MFIEDIQVYLHHPELENDVYVPNVHQVLLVDLYCLLVCSHDLLFPKRRWNSRFDLATAHSMALSFDVFG